MSESTGTPGGYGAMPLDVEPPPVVTPPPLVRPPQVGPIETIDPWISIWTRPRATLRQILDSDPRRSVFRLAALGGIAEALRLATAPSLGDTYPAWAILAVAVAGGSFGGILSLLIFTGLLRAAGRWLGGCGETRELMAALAWAHVPQIWGLVLWLPMVALLGQEMFRSLPDGIEGNPPATALFGLLRLALGLIGLWGFLISLKCIAEAHRFSAWRALGALVLAALMIGVPAGLLMIAAQSLS